MRIVAILLRWIVRSCGDITNATTYFPRWCGDNPVGFARFQRCREPLLETVPKRGIGNKRHPAPKKMATTPAPGAGAIFLASAIGADAGSAASATLPFSAVKPKNGISASCRL